MTSRILFFKNFAKIQIFYIILQKIMKNSPRKSIIQNKKALFDYEIIEELDAGIILLWGEVKSLRWWQANLKGSYVTLHSGRPFLIGSHISEYKNNTNKKIDPKRERELLLSKKEITHLSQKIKEIWATLIAKEILSVGNIFKVRLALAKWRKKWQKKQLLKERDLSREVRKFY